MNIPTPFTSTCSRQQDRRGISILEVLFSIGIATIGLFGVLALIPFAVHQANVGLNIERGMTTGRNAMAEFEIRGYHDPNSWFFADLDPNTNLPAIVNYDSRDSYVIDPEFIGHYGNFTPTVDFPVNNGRQYFPSVEDPGTFATQYPGLFPPGSLVDDMLDRRPLIYRGTINQNGTWMQKAMARQIVSNLDDITYKFRDDATTLEDEFAPPKAEYIMIDDGSGTQIPAKRQTAGEFSWMAFVRPEKLGYEGAEGETGNYSIDMVVMHQREGLGDDSVAPNPLVQDDTTYDRVFVVNRASFVNNLLTSGVEIELSQECRSNTVTSPRNPDWLEIKDGDWIVLTNRTYGFRWYQVDNVDPGTDTDPGTWRMTIQGPTFYKDPADITYAIHVRNVVNVFTKTFMIEQNSTWK